ncbi:hypothetical protein HPG69_005802 [Diceros bicornis minor]|uniref:Olfactory receptor n=1 Tax=Diceros bicornis minor TaxID=77932 RepID=A0A7J7ET42_DICBM|nr:hypothetical protein HPG69_005802 [Diceros bicornis minor]
MSEAKISCSNVKTDAIYGLMVALLIGGFAILCITISCTMILRAVVSLSSADVRQKTFSTCTAHICDIINTYVPAFFTLLIHHFGGHTIPPQIHIIMVYLYLLMPPTMNPIVYNQADIRKFMLVSNNSYVAPKSFIRNGIPGLERVHMWISLPFCTMYIISLVGKLGLVYLIHHEESLHHPIACLVQMLFVHGFTGVESGVLMLMALDCCVAICHPLCHATILTNSFIAKAGLATLLRGML